MPKVSVIVPVYNTELYVERAIISLMEQTLDDVQYIIIDDGSKDNSFSIIERVITRYSGRQGQVILITRENRGVAATRAQGIELATGDYVIHLDSDDWAELNWLESMYTKAIEENADIVVCDYLIVYESRSVHKRQVIAGNSIDCLKNLLLGNVANSSCNKLVARNIFIDNKVTFHGGYDMGEDFLVTLLIFMKAKNIIHIDKALYFYNQTNENSLTSNYSPKTLKDLSLVTNLASDYLCQNGLSKIVEREFNLFKLTVVSLFVAHSYGDVNKIKFALRLYPSANKMILFSKMRMLKVVYILNEMRLLFLYPYIMRIKTWLKI